MGGGRLINLAKLCLCTSDLEPRNVVRHANWLTTYVSLVISTLPYICTNSGISFGLTGFAGWRKNEEVRATFRLITNN